MITWFSILFLLPLLLPLSLSRYEHTKTKQKNTRLRHVIFMRIVVHTNAPAPLERTHSIHHTRKRYYNREAVVISALQVEKHPLTTPGPFATPPPPRHVLAKKHSTITMTPPMSRIEVHSRTASPLTARAGSYASVSYGSPRFGDGIRSSPKPHSSPKMKLRFNSISSLLQMETNSFTTFLFVWFLCPIFPLWVVNVVVSYSFIVSFVFTQFFVDIFASSWCSRHCSYCLSNTAFSDAWEECVLIICFLWIFRYLKGIYPKAEETLLLDILASADNNVQKASETLVSMGYEKRDAVPPRASARSLVEQVQKAQSEAERTPPPLPKFKSIEEKQKSNETFSRLAIANDSFTFQLFSIFLVKNQLQARYKDVADRIITMALESVDYSEEKASKILEIVLQDDKTAKAETKKEVTGEASVESGTVSSDAPPPQPPSTLKPDSRYVDVVALTYFGYASPCS